MWICPSANGHLQATGRDARGRKQYRYHPRWREVRDETKYDRMIAFGQALPRIRARVERGPGAARACRARRCWPRSSACWRRRSSASATRSTPGTNDSFGLTTLRNRHVDGRGGRRCASASAARAASATRSTCSDRRLARDRPHAARTCRARSCSSTSTTTGSATPIDSADVNEYLREIAGEEFTAKDFRTWAGTVLAAQALQEFDAFDSQAQAKRNVVAAIESVAKRLGNTHGRLPQVLRPPGGPRRLPGWLPGGDA